MEVDGDDQTTYEVLMQAEHHDTGRLLRTILEAGGEVLGFQRARRHLDEAFMDLTEPGVRS